MNYSTIINDLIWPTKKETISKFGGLRQMKAAPPLIGKNEAGSSSCPNALAKGPTVIERGYLISNPRKKAKRPGPKTKSNHG